MFIIKKFPDAHIYTTKIDVVVCPPNISETVAGRLMKLAHRPRIASTMIKLISKPILLPILQILLKTIQPISAAIFCFRLFGRLRSFPRFPGSVTHSLVRVKGRRVRLCFAITESG